MSETKETKIAGKGVVVALGIVCILLVTCLGVVIAAYAFLISDKDNAISSLYAQISELNSNLANLQLQITSDNTTINSLTSDLTSLQGQLNSILNGSTSLLGVIANDPSSWVNRTVTVEGNLDYAKFFVGGTFLSPYDFELSSDSQTFRVALNSSQYEWFLNNFDIPGAHGPPRVMIYGVVRKGEFNIINFGPYVTYYIEAQAVEPF